MEHELAKYELRSQVDRDEPDQRAWGLSLIVPPQEPQQEGDNLQHKHTRKVIMKVDARLKLGGGRDEKSRRRKRKKTSPEKKKTLRNEILLNNQFPQMIPQSAKKATLTCGKYIWELLSWFGPGFTAVKVMVVAPTSPQE